MMIQNFSGTLMYTSLSGDKDSDVRYWDGAMSISVKDCRTYDVDIRLDVKDSDGRNHHVG